MPEDANFDDSDFVGIPEAIDTPPPERVKQRQRWIPLTLIGCGCGLPLVAIALVLSGLSSTLIRFYQSTGTYQVYQLAAAKVEHDPAVIQALGQPVKAGWTSQSRESYSGSSPGQVCLRFTVTGANQSGSSYAEAQKQAGAWQLHQLTVAVNGRAEPLIVQALPAAASPLCPNFDAPELEAPESIPKEALPDGSTPI